MALIRIGLLGRAHGLKGELILDDCTLTADELRAISVFTCRRKGSDDRRLDLTSVREIHGKFLVGFRGFEERDRARELTLGELFAEESQLPDPGPGVAYAFQLVGARRSTPRTAAGSACSNRSVPTGANRVFVVQGEREWLIPATEQVLRHVDLARRGDHGGAAAGTRGAVRHAR
jgi:16S rRNA processing protein RimM